MGLGVVFQNKAIGNSSSNSRLYTILTSVHPILSFISVLPPQTPHRKKLSLTLYLSTSFSSPPPLPATVTVTVRGTVQYKVLMFFSRNNKLHSKAYPTTPQPQKPPLHSPAPKNPGSPTNLPEGGNFKKKK